MSEKISFLKMRQENEREYIISISVIPFTEIT
jgi:hypothetical protein